MQYKETETLNSRIKEPLTMGKPDHDYDTLCMWEKAVEKDLTRPDKILPVQSTSDKNRISDLLSTQIRKIRSPLQRISTVQMP